MKVGRLTRLCNRLERNKIIIETSIAIFLAVIGVTTSITGLVVSLNANRISAQQNELLAQQQEIAAQQRDLLVQQYDFERFGAEPVFTMEWEIGEDGSPYYVIKNIGAKIHDANYSVNYRLNEHRLLYSGIALSSRYNDEFDVQTQSFHIPVFPLFMGDEPFNVVAHINEGISKYFEEYFERGFSLWFSQDVSIEIRYANYLNERHKKTISYSTNDFSDERYGEDFIFLYNLDILKGYSEPSFELSQWDINKNGIESTKEIIESVKEELEAYFEEFEAFIAKFR